MTGSVKKRNILLPAPLVPAEEGGTEPVLRASAKKLATLASNLALQGISMGKTPKVMIRDEGEDKMYFLKEGQVIGATRIKVKSISRDEVIISYGEEEMELL